jgi:hypothetical protein
VIIEKTVLHVIYDRSYLRIHSSLGDRTSELQSRPRIFRTPTCVPQPSQTTFETVYIRRLSSNVRFSYGDSGVTTLVAKR